MGQQQLLLLVLGAVIVGVAIIIGINMFGEGALKAQEDAAKQTLVTMAGRAEEWYRKPTALGGGNKVLTGLTTFQQIGYRYHWNGSAITTNNVYEDEHAIYTLTGGASPVTIDAQLKTDSSITLRLSLIVSLTNNNILTATIADKPA